MQLGSPIGASTEDMLDADLFDDLEQSLLQLQAHSNNNVRVNDQQKNKPKKQTKKRHACTRTAIGQYGNCSRKQTLLRIKKTYLNGTGWCREPGRRRQGFLILEKAEYCKLVRRLRRRRFSERLIEKEREKQIRDKQQASSLHRVLVGKTK